MSFLPVVAYFFLFLMLQAHALLLDTCFVDSSICSSLYPPKLTVDYQNSSVSCNDVLLTHDIKQPPRITFSQGTEGEHYVLLILDPDEPRPCANTDNRNYVCYASVLTLEKGELTMGQNLINYHGSRNIQETHRYQFYVFPWALNQKPNLNHQNRQEFYLHQFQDVNHLSGPVAVFQMRVQKRF